MTNAQNNLTDTDRQVVRCYTYARVAQSKPWAMEWQIEACHALAETLSTSALDYQVVRVFQDDGFSGHSGHRPGYKEMLEGLERGDAAVVLVFSEDRLYRNVDEQKAYSELSDRLSVTTFSTDAGRVSR